MGLIGAKAGFYKGPALIHSWRPETTAYMNAIAIPNDDTVFYEGTAYEITGNGMWLVTDNELITPLLDFGYWDRIDAGYAYLGGTAASHKINFINPVDSDAAFRLTYQGTVTHGPTGMTFSSGGYADTKLIPISTLTENDTHMSYYSRTATSIGSYDMGIIDSGTNNRILLIVKHSNSFTYSDQYDGATTTRVQTNAATDGTGFFMPTRVANNDHRILRNGLQIGATNTSTVSPTGFLNLNRSIFIGAANWGGSALSPSARNTAFNTIGGGFTPTEGSNINTIVQNFNTGLFRAIP